MVKFNILSLKYLWTFGEGVPGDPRPTNTHIEAPPFIFFLLLTQKTLFLWRCITPPTTGGTVTKQVSPSGL